MTKEEIYLKYKGGFSLFSGYKTVELIPEPKNNKDNLLWLWCYDANLIGLDFANASSKMKTSIINELANRNSLKSVLITVVIDGYVVLDKGHLTKIYKYEENND